MNQPFKKRRTWEEIFREKRGIPTPVPKEIGKKKKPPKPITPKVPGGADHWI